MSLTRKRQAIAEALADPKNLTLTAIAEKVGVERKTVYEAEKNPEVQALVKRKRKKVEKIGRSSIEGIKSGISILQDAIAAIEDKDTPPTDQELAKIDKMVSTLATVAEKSHTGGWDETAPETVTPEDVEKTRNDLLLMGIPPEVVEYYLEHGEVPENLHETPRSNTATTHAVLSAPKCPKSSHKSDDS
jgi:hypothetical protein